MDIPKRQCIKVAELRKIYTADINLRDWLANPNHLYVGRRGRIFIANEVFYYPQSKWANPFTLKDYTLEESLTRYRDYIINSDLINQVGELKGLTLGCFCPSHQRCHVDVLIELYSIKQKGMRKIVVKRL